MEKLIKIGRRAALQRIATATTVGTLAPAAALAEQSGATSTAAPAKPPRPPTDPDLRDPVITWDKVLTPAELRTVAVVCDVIIPADEKSPAASAVGVPDFINEWVSAPYPEQKNDLLIVRGGLAWLNRESNKRFGKTFGDLSQTQRHRICDDICNLKKTKGRLRAGARFFDRMRNLTMTGFYTTEEGNKDIQYLGNTPSATFEGPPREVLARLKLL